MIMEKAPRRAATRTPHRAATLAPRRGGALRGATLTPRRAPAPAVGPRRGTVAGVAAGATGMVFVGGSVAVSKVLAGAPVFTAEAVRYGAACLLLVTLA
ncbi:MAG TPA: hypothetical protein VGI96_48860, partial [Streptosporangiaceae bacterium]